MRKSRVLSALLVLCAACGPSKEEWRAKLSAQDPFERGMSALALAQVSPEDCGEAIPRLLELVDGHDEALGSAASRQLARVAPTNLPALMHYFTAVPDSSPEFRRALREAIVAAGAVAVEPVRARLVSSGASNPREMGRILADIGESSVAPLVADLSDADVRRRIYTCWTLARLGAKAHAAAPRLLRVLAQDDPLVARQAALALAEIAPGEDSTRAALEGAFARGRGELAETLREALARLALHRAGLGIREDTQARLFALGAESLVPAAEACADENPLLRAAGEARLRECYRELALGLEPARLGGDRDAIRLQEQLDDKDPGTRARAALAIAVRGARAAEFLHALALRLCDEHAGVVCSARLALLHVLRCIALEGWRRTR
ncbi:MAG: hypothetical protein IPJ19_08330 [Planctomycetes bacterium]|nr:hypothetical protein [Planctomycetota bacterium]